jgi:chemotaxis protein CheC
MNVKNLNEKQKDALRELGNIGAAHAATALSQMVHHKIKMTVPKVQIIDPEKLAMRKKFKNKSGIGIYTNLYGKLKGKILLFFEYSNALRLSEILLGKKNGSITIIKEVEESALKEVGNILAASYLNAVSQIIDGVLLPSIPLISIDSLNGILTYFAVHFTGVIQNGLWIETELVSDERKISGDFFLFPNKNSLELIFEAMKV